MWEFKLGGIDDLRRVCEEHGVSVGAGEDTSILREPVQAGSLRIPNSLAVHPMEGCDGDSQGRPSPLTVRRYQRFARGGAGLLWAEAIAVVREARANPRQLWLHSGSKSSFESLVRMMRREAAASMGPDHKPVIVAQLTHSGRYSKPEGVAHPLIPQRDPYRDPLVPEKFPSKNRASRIPDDWPLLSDEYLDILIGDYVEAARIAFEAGFDAVDIKSCHGYLINELFASRNRQGKYGGSFENRTRFVLDVIDAIRSELGEDKPIVSRLGIYDAIPYPYGWGVDENDYTKADLAEPKKLISEFEKRGVKLVNLTIANPYYNPHVGRPFNEPITGGYDEPEHPVVGVERLVRLAGEIQKEFPEMAFVGTGYSWLRTLFANVAAASKAEGLATLIGGGRMSFAYPDFAKDIVTRGAMDPRKVCIGCSACTQIMRDGGKTGCVVRDNEVYGPIFEHGRMSDRANLERLGQACRECQEPTCQLACPAGIAVPQFIRKFLDGDDKGAYEVLRQRNVFPEICARLCPVEQQCQGYCLQKFIGDGPLPIAHIQRYLSEQANKNGWSKIKVPQEAAGGRIAIIGAGPAGLACAARLLEMGHTVEMFDKRSAFGGMVDSVIPAERQQDALNNEIAAVFRDVPSERFVKHAGKGLDEKFDLDEVMEQFDAAFVGLGLPRAISIATEKLDGLYNAMEFLEAAKSSDGLDLSGKSVAVVGGGNTAMDAAVTACDRGASDVYVVYRRSFKEMPAWSAERDHAMDRGVHFLILTATLGYNGEDGRLSGLKACPTRLGPADESGRRRPQPIEDSAYDLPMDVVVEAIGQQSAANIAQVLNGVKLDGGLVEVDNATLSTSRQGVFAGGDIARGASTVVAAVADGMKAATKIDEYLAGKS